MSMDVVQASFQVELGPETAAGDRRSRSLQADAVKRSSTHAELKLSSVF